MIELHKKKGRVSIDLAAYNMGKDLCVLLTGGDTPHLGAICIGSKQEDLTTFSFQGHKEAILTEILAKALKENLNGNFVVCGGVHIDKITNEEIQIAKLLCEQIAVELASLIS